MKVYAGIDNGLRGGVVAIRYTEDGRSEIVFAEAAPVMTYHHTKRTKRVMYVRGMVGLVNRLRELGAHVVLEEAQAMPKQGVVSMYNTGLGRGLWEGMLAHAEVEYETVYSRTWTAELFRGMPFGGDQKVRAKAYAQRMFPGDFFIPAGCRVVHDGLCDAACLAAWGRLRYGVM